MPSTRGFRVLVVSTLALVAAAFALPASASADTMKLSVVYSDSSCSGTPTLVQFSPAPNCTTTRGLCDTEEYNGRKIHVLTNCVDEPRQAYVATKFGSSRYATVEAYAQDDCQSLLYSSSFLAADTCLPGNKNISVRTRLNANGSAALLNFQGVDCGGEPTHPLHPTEEDIATHACVNERYKFYSSVNNVTKGLSNSSSSSSSSGSSSSGSSSSSVSSVGDSSAEAETSSTSLDASDSAASGLSAGGIAGVAIAGTVLLLLVAAFVLWRRRVSATREQATEIPSPGDSELNGLSKLGAVYRTSSGTKASMAAAHAAIAPTWPQGDDSISMPSAGLWGDEAIVAARIPREKVVVKQCLSRGVYGEVYVGTFNGEQVAVKMLPPETRGSGRHMNALLAEVKMMAAMEHPRIVRFVGVAWDSLTDLCVVSEFMADGDLRALLSKFEDVRHPRGFDKPKVRIALHVAHALTYLHSLEPPVLHRDLKSRNILLGAELDAKVTGFGMARERVDRTMTAGVGTSLWMAPEVVMGEQYGTKADVFSFGVVLSELDSHSLPYAHVTDSSNSGRKMPEAVILQLVTMGHLSVDFSGDEAGSAPMVELGKACVAVDPAERPTAAEALYKLQTILRRDMQ